ncbi:MAG: RNA-directed DNA polymerase [Sediminicola sp.]
MSNILLDELDKERSRRERRYIRYADDFRIYAKSKAEASRIGKSVFIFYEIYTCLSTSKRAYVTRGIIKTSTFELLGHGFVRVYKKGVKEQCQFVVKKKSWESLERKLKDFTKKTKPYVFKERFQKLAEV